MIRVFLMTKVRKTLLCLGTLNGDIGGGGEGDLSLFTDNS
jgi:hypothetical protein